MGDDAILRVASFNLRNGLAWDWCNSWPLRRQVCLRTLRALDADIIGVQEAFGFQLRWLLRHLPEYVSVGDGRDGAGRGEHVDLLIRGAGLRVVDYRTRWFGDSSDRPSRLSGSMFPRTVTTAVIENRAGVQLHVANTHLDERSAERRHRSAVQLVDWLDPSVPQVVVGDFNATPDDPMFGDFARRGLRHALPHDAGGTVHRFTGRRDGRRLDHILVNDRVEVLGAHVEYGELGARLASDHWPVVADVAVARPDRRPGDSTRGVR